MNNIQVFNNRELNVEVRTIVNQDGSILISAEDTAKGFGWTRVATSGNEVIRWDRVNKYICELGPYPQVGMNDYIPESLFYMLGMKASNAVAQKFQKWLAIDVIPSIRRTGGYLGTDETMTDEEIMAKALMVAQKTIKKKDELLKAKDKELKVAKEDLNTKNRFINQIAVSQNSLKVEEVAQIASKNGIKIGRNRLWDRLREWGIIKKNSKYDPKQEYVDRGYFEVVEGTRENSKGVFTYKTTRVLGKGQVYIINRLLKERTNNENNN